MGSLKTLLLFLLALTTAAATPLTVAIDSQGRYLSPFYFTGYTGGAYAGTILVDLAGIGVYDGYCIDLHTDITPGVLYDVNLWLPFSEASLNHSAGIPRAAWLFVNYRQLVNGTPSQPLRGIRGAALQLAIWDVVHDEGNGLFAGSIQVNTAITAANNIAATDLAQSWILASRGHWSNDAAILIHVQGPDVAQSLITYRETMNPEPSTALLAGGALVAVLGLRRRYRSCASSR